jgi:hypothetical protein
MSKRRMRVDPSVGEVVPPTQGPPAPTSWVDWYNHRATPEQQQQFDYGASVIDNGGVPFQKGGPEDAWVETWRLRQPAYFFNAIERYKTSDPSFWQALLNYRDTGGRAALFHPPKDYGPRPISEPHQTGPIEVVNPTMLVLHPGRYSYSDVTANGPAFRDWLDIVKKAVTVGQKQISSSVIPGGDPYYIDYEFTVTQDTAWPTIVNGQKLHGNPTWVPKGINIVTYWGQVTTSHPDWDAPGRLAAQAGDMVKGIATLAGVLALAYVVYTLKPAPPPPEPRRLS